MKRTSRPVRKGDLVNGANYTSVVFIATSGADVIFWEPDMTCAANAPVHRGHWTHADGSPIDWEASE